jgi:DNA-directed RNA polymerase subunit beta'
MAKTADFLDAIKNLGFYSAFKGGLSFNLDDVIIPEEKTKFVTEGYEQVEEVLSNYSMGFITNNERYNQIIDIWTHVNARLTQSLMKQLSTDKQGFNSVYMMLDSGARGSKEQIRQLSGMRGLMAKPQKSGSTGSRSSKTLSFLTSRKDCRFSNTLFQHMVPEKVLPIRLLKQPMQDT